MKPGNPLKLLSEVRDLQVVDSEERNCGICDDIELEGAPGGPLKIAALLVGPGAYAKRLPKWAGSLIATIAGRSAVRVPWATVEKISGRIFLTEPGAELGLRRVEDRWSKRLKRMPFS